VCGALGCTVSSTELLSTPSTEKKTTPIWIYFAIIYVDVVKSSLVRTRLFVRWCVDEHFQAALPVPALRS